MRNFDDIYDNMSYLECMLRRFIKQTSVEKFKELKEIVENER